MGLIGLVFVIAGFIGVILGFFRIAIYAFKEQGPLWGLLCLLVPSANLVWGVIHWQDKESRTLFIRYLGCAGLWILGRILMRWAASDV